jgi:hypothetical protein
MFLFKRCNTQCFLRLVRVGQAQYICVRTRVCVNVISGNSVFDVLIGNREWMKCNDLVISDDINLDMQNLEATGHTVVLCAIDGTLFAEFQVTYVNCIVSVCLSDTGFIHC